MKVKAAKGKMLPVVTAAGKIIYIGETAVEIDQEKLPYQMRVEFDKALKAGEIAEVKEK